MGDLNAQSVDVAIVGAGLAGTLLALSLQHHLPHLSPSKITLFESRPPNAPELASGVVLTPNGLRVLEKLGLYARIKQLCWTNEYRTYVNDEDEVTRQVLVASEGLYGFKNHRLYRRVLLQVIKDTLVERGIEVRYHQRFERVLRDDETGVTFSVNGVSHRTSLLIGADGIYSQVRTYLAPSIQPIYTGTVGVLAHIKHSAVLWPSRDFPKQCTIQSKPGAIFMIPEDPPGDDLMVGRQMAHPDMSREAWTALSANKEALSAFFRRNYDEWHDTGRKVIDAVTDPDAGRESLYLWPFLRTPRLEKWYSDAGNVVLVGDAAHAIPPSSGQGVNQALEDVWSLGLVLGQTAKRRPEALRFWQRCRERRVERVFEWAVGATNVSRMGELERQRLVSEGKIPRGTDHFDDMSWLYGFDTEGEIEAWMSGVGTGGEGG